jgi:hypothetical protein
MKDYYNSYTYKGSLLMSLPSVHFQTSFAEQVNSICRDKYNQPNAIAVELGHPLVVELVNFLKELKQGRPEKNLLPCMMGVLKRNRYIHTDYIERALLLQEIYRLPVYELPENLLADRLNFSKWSTLYMSPADSIIEAVRCAIELNIPVYGIDLNDFAVTTTKHILIEDPQSASYDIHGYVNRVMKYCSSGRDLQIDLNREYLMASGLKYCLEKHRKVLFTCGLAHYRSIISLMDNDRILPFPVHEIPAKSEFRRVIVHPSLAATVMEIIPQITFNYENERQPVIFQKQNKIKAQSHIAIRKCLDSAYKEYISAKEIKKGSGKWSDIGNFEQYLFRLSLVRQRRIPDMGTILVSAKAMMDNDFCRLLVRKMMEVSPDWVSSNEFPGLPVIQESGGDAKDIEWQTSNMAPRDITEKWEWRKLKKINHEALREGNPWIWPPCESLIYGIAFKAAEISNNSRVRIHDSSPFDGSLEAGIDVKASMRSVIRGEKKIYVSKLVSGLEQAILDGTYPDPFVIVFDGPEDLSIDKWRFYTAGSGLDLFVKDPELYKKITNSEGNVFVSSILLEESVAPPSHLRSLVYDMSKTFGTIMFGNPCINSKQSAAWLETSSYKCCPVLTNYGMDSLIKYYSDCFNMKFDLYDWKESLIRMAIPFAKKMVTILAPDSLCIPERVKIEAYQKNVALNIVSISNFRESQLEEARHRFSIRTLDRAGLEFPPETEVLLGQTKETYFEMLPYAIRKQVGYTINNHRE